MALFFGGWGGNQEKRIFSRSPNISKHNGDDGPNHYNHISNDKIFKVEKNAKFMTHDMFLIENT